MIPLIGVIGSRECDERIGKIAYDVGYLIAKNGFGLVCGGKGGVMRTAAEGCKAGGGMTVGIIPTEKINDANPFIDIIIPTGMGIMRNLLVVRSAQGIIAVSGGYGTLSEIAYALQLSIPVVGVETWNVSTDIHVALTAQQAVEYLIKGIHLSNGQSG